MKAVLLAAGLYNLVWGAMVIAAPLTSLKWSGFTLPTPYPEHWQCIGMIVGVYGIGYAIAAFDPVRHWPIVLVGLLGKIFGPIGMILAWIKGTLPLSTFPTILTNDLIWWIPFGLILWHVWKIETGSASARAATAS
ncbi:MAG: alkyl hydroperoxide reductase [Planctomyces sp.]|nr:alkyl hydroperoxide reductase [Planctomyces sp.]